MSEKAPQPAAESITPETDGFTPDIDQILSENNAASKRRAAEDEATRQEEIARRRLAVQETWLGKQTTETSEGRLKATSTLAKQAKTAESFKEYLSARPTQDQATPDFGVSIESLEAELKFAKRFKASDTVVKEFEKQIAQQRSLESNDLGQLREALGQARADQNEVIAKALEAKIKPIVDTQRKNEAAARNRPINERLRRRSHALIKGSQPTPVGQNPAAKQTEKQAESAPKPATTTPPAAEATTAKPARARRGFRGVVATIGDKFKSAFDKAPKKAPSQPAARAVTDKGDGRQQSDNSKNAPGSHTAENRVLPDPNKSAEENRKALIERASDEQLSEMAAAYDLIARHVKPGEIIDTARSYKLLKGRDGLKHIDFELFSAFLEQAAAQGKLMTPSDMKPPEGEATKWYLRVDESAEAGRDANLAGGEGTDGAAAAPAGDTKDKADDGNNPITIPLTPMARRGSREDGDAISWLSQKGFKWESGQAGQRDKAQGEALYKAQQPQLKKRRLLGGYAVKRSLATDIINVYSANPLLLGLGGERLPGVIQAINNESARNPTSLKNMTEGAKRRAEERQDPKKRLNKPNPGLIVRATQRATQLDRQTFELLHEKAYEPLAKLYRRRMEEYEQRRHAQASHSEILPGKDSADEDDHLTKV